MSLNPWRSIAPASRSAPPPGQKPPTRPSIPVACLHCRLKKAKCDGARPTCTRCQDAELSCQYDVTHGVTRAERFRLQKQRQASVTNNLTLLVDALRSGSDLEATTLLARLRLGEGVEELLKDLDTVALASQDPLGRTTSPANSSTGTAYSELATDHVDRLPSGSDNLGVMDRLGTTGLDVNEPFLSVLFKLDELLHTLQEDVPDTEEDCSMPVPVPMLYGSLGIVSSRNLHAPETNPSIVHESSSDLTAPLRALLANRNAAWITYPKVQDNLIIAPSFQVHPSNVALSASGAFVPLWAMMSVNLKSQRDPLYSAFKGIMYKATNLIRNGTPPEEVFGDQPDIAALLDEQEHKKAPLLSQWAASMVHSVRKRGNDFTCFASMHLFWYLMRWMILPAQDTYKAVPEWLRPTPNQLFLPHMYMIDFVVWPKLREFAVSTPPMQEKMDWLVDLSTHIRCYWPFGIEEATCKDAETGLIVLTVQAKKQMSDLSNWSVGPTFRAYVPNADMYVSVRSEYR